MKKLTRRVYRLKPTIVRLIFLGIMSWFIWKIGLPAYRFAQDNSLDAAFVKNAFFSETVPLNSTNGRTNVLLMGAELTDTILVYSFNQTKKKSYIVAVPYDVWSDTLKDKINSAYQYGEARKKGGGFLLAKATVEEVIGEPVHYAYLVDFQTVEAIIDVLGGVDVHVEQSSDQHMDGAAVFQFIRSDDDGSDLARLKRQEKTVEAVITKVLDHTTYTSFALVSNLVSQVTASTQTDANLGESWYIVKLLLQLKDRKTITLDNQLTSPPVWQYDDRGVLVPKESWEVIHSFIVKSLEE